mmetsp:Transcript_19937/g.41194  ORF Transcript_19937/g.41194 Transcript_19937/m.41194 type:complete len:85 (+) Transcript_19937:1306-1560(+)
MLQSNGSRSSALCSFNVAWIASPRGSLESSFISFGDSSSSNFASAVKKDAYPEWCSIKINNDTIYKLFILTFRETDRFHLILVI